MSDGTGEQLLKDLHSSLVSWTHACKDLTAREQTVVGLRAGLQLIPFGIGSALDAGYFGSLDTRRAKKVDETLGYLTEGILHLGEKCAQSLTPAYFGTDEFACLFEECWRRLLVEAQQEKLRALRNALLNIVVNRPHFVYAEKEFFIKSLDGMADTHIHILQVLRSRFGSSNDTFETQELWSILRASEQAHRDYAYAALDVLANRRYIEHRSVPQVEDGRIDYPRQKFRLTHLGADFMDFICANDETS